MAIEVIAGETLGFVMGVLGKAGSKVLEGVAKTGAEKLLTYLKTKLGEGPEAQALQQLEADPEAIEGEAQLKEALMARMESDKGFAQELTKMLESLQQEINVSNKQVGDKNKNAQVTGNNIKIQM
ncbi:hypothetical protein QMT40_000411 [Parvibaculaceae bacterium PLY_AMNH_Bact1]|nr:hypothetical protein QMT40_000411 [Parvibaculaceae bacterium PLY_AMNH_Bact1]